MTDEYGARVEDLKSRRKKNLAMGGEEKIAKQHQRGKLTVRERIDLLFDAGTFVELGLLAQARDGSEDTPADGVVTGHGDVDGRQVWVVAYDFTVMAGSMDIVIAAGVESMTRVPMGLASQLPAKNGFGHYKSPSSSKQRACETSRFATASRSCGCSTRQVLASRKRRARRLPARAGFSPTRS